MLQNGMYFIDSFIFVLAVVIGVGPQNLSVISHGINRNYSYLVASVACSSNILLLIIGGISLSLNHSSVIILTINIICLIFIGSYILQKIRVLFQYKKIVFSKKILTRREALINAIVMTWLNPLVFIDSFLVVGGSLVNYSGLSWFAAIVGAILANITWMYGITIVARKFSSQLNRKWVWFILDLSTIFVLALVFYKVIKSML